MGRPRKEYGDLPVIADALRHGWTLGEIAAQWNLSLRQVQGRIHAIKRKLAARDQNPAWLDANHVEAGRAFLDESVHKLSGLGPRRSGGCVKEERSADARPSKT